VHIPSDFIAHVAPGLSGSLIGDKTWSLIYDNSKIKTFVPGFQALIPFRKGIRRTLAWFHEDQSRQHIDEAVNEEMSRILFAYIGSTRTPNART
jgi:hypothetical protein